MKNILSRNRTKFYSFPCVIKFHQERKYQIPQEWEHEPWEGQTKCLKDEPTQKSYIYQENTLKEEIVVPKYKIPYKGDTTQAQENTSRHRLHSSYSS